MNLIKKDTRIASSVELFRNLEPGQLPVTNEEFFDNALDRRRLMRMALVSCVAGGSITCAPPASAFWGAIARSGLKALAKTTASFLGGVLGSRFSNDANFYNYVTTSRPAPSGDRFNDYYAIDKVVTNHNAMVKPRPVMRMDGRDISVGLNSFTSSYDLNYQELRALEQKPCPRFRTPYVPYTLRFRIIPEYNCFVLRMLDCNGFHPCDVRPEYIREYRHPETSHRIAGLSLKVLRCNNGYLPGQNLHYLSV